MSVGMVSTWPPALRIAVTSALDSPIATIVLWGTDLIQIYNDCYKAILGPRHPRSMGQRTCECWPEVWHFNEPIYASVMATGETSHFDDQKFVLEEAGGSIELYFTVTYSALRDEAGNVCGVMVRVIETTEKVALRKDNASLTAAAAAAARRQAFNLRVADALRPLMDPDEVLASASAILGAELGACRVLYCEVDDAHGSCEIRRDWTRPGVQSVSGQIRNLSEFGDELMDVLRSGETLVINDVAIEARATDVRAGYASLDLKAFLAIPLLQEGKLSVVLVVHHTEPYTWSAEELQFAHDFVERTWAAAENAKAQATLRIERDRTQSVFDCMLEGFVLVDRENVVLQMNDEGLRIAQHKLTEVIGRRMSDVWPEIQGTPLAHLYARVIDTGISDIIEYEHTFWNGVKSWLEVRAYRTPSYDLAIFFRNIDERKLAQEVLVEADRNKDEFLAMLAHELRNPLSPISAAASLLSLRGSDEKLVKRASDVILRQVQHMSGLVDDLLDVSRVTRGVIELATRIVDVKSIIAEAVEQVQPAIESCHHNLVVSLSPVSAFVEGDQKRLVQVIANLLSNAAKFTPTRGDIVISTEHRDSNIAIVVRDTGIGMSPEMLTRAFKLFAQETRTSDRSQGGLGLGLALVKSIVELHDGTAMAHSSGVGRGSEFTIVLPSVAAPIDTRCDVAANQVDRGLQSMRLLVVDDNADSAEMMATLLTTLGCSVVTELSGLAGLARAEVEPFAACLLDIGLPDIDGFALCSAIRADTASRHAKLIAITGYGQEKDRIESASAGFDHHLVKPLDIATLIRVLEDFGSPSPSSD